jgi:tetratricopeptide (TPR) repeat protein
MKKSIRMLFILMAVAAVALTGAGCTAKAKKAYHLSRANRFYDAGQYGRAEIEYINVLRNDQANAEAYGRLGLIYYDQGRLQRAMYFLAKGSQLAPDNLQLRLKLGYLYSSVGQFTQAVAQATYILDKNPKDDQAPILLAEGSFRPKDTAAARERLQALARNGDSAAIEVALGNLALNERDIATASADYKKAQALDPKSPEVNAALGMVAWAQGDLKQAETSFKAAADASPPRSPHQMQYVRFKLQTGDHEGARALLAGITKAAPDYLPASMMLAEISAAEKKYDESTDWLNKVLQLDQDNFDALFFQGQLDIARGDADKAVSDMERMERIYPQAPQVHYQLGSAYLAANSLPKAADSFNRALELNPNYTEATLLLSQIQIRTGNTAPAIVALERLRQKQPRLLQAQLMLADAYRLQSRVNDSIAVYDSLEKMYPTNEQVVLLHGAALLQNGDSPGARTEFERALKISPDHLPALERLVDLDISEKKFDEATQLISGEIQRNPKLVTLVIIKAKIALAQGNSGQAELILAQALTMDPDNVSADLLLAQLYADTGQNEKALAKVDAAMSKDTKNTSALMLAAKIYEANKDYKGAADAYEKVLKIDPKNSEAMNNVAYLYSEFLNNLDRAYELAQSARQLLPYDPSTADTLGWVCFKKGLYPAALGFLKESISKLATVPEVQFHYGMASYMAADEATARTALQLAWQSGKDFPDRDECANCISILNINPATADAATQATLEKRVAAKPDDPVAQVRLARIYQRGGNYDKAIAAYEAILQAVPKNMDAMVNLVQLYTPKDSKKAYEMAKAANKIAPYDADLTHTMGRLAFLVGDYQEATSTLQPLLQNQPTNASLFFDYALAAYSIGKISDAQSALQNAQTLNLPAVQAEQARRTLDMIALAADPAQAAAAGARIQEVLKSQPDDAPALMAWAAASGFKSDSAAAEQAYEKVLAHYPDFTPAEIRLARLYADEPANLNRAYELATKAHDELPNDPRVTKILGIILCQHGDYGRAANMLKESALKLNSDAELYYFLGTAQYHLKRMTESKTSFQQALALNLSGKQADAAKQMLSQMK